MFMHVPSCSQYQQYLPSYLVQVLFRCSQYEQLVTCM